MDSTSQAQQVASAEGAGAGTYTRKASGIARSFAPFDAYAYNTMASAPIAFSAMSFLFILAFWPRANLTLGICLAAGLIVVPLVVTQALLQTGMPRVGGEYVWTSRTLNGGLAVALDLGNYSVIAAMWIAVGGYLLATQIIAPMVTIMAYQWDSPALKSIAAFHNTSGGVLLWGLIATGATLLLGLYPLKIYAKVQKYFYWIGLACLIIICIYMALTTNSHFMSSLNENSIKYFNVNDAYNTVMSRAAEAGFDGNTTFSFGQTWSALTLFLFVVMYVVWSSGFAGELRDKNSLRSKLVQMGGALLTSITIAIAIGLLTSHMLGRDFMSAAAYLWYNAPDQYPYPVAPMWAFFVSMIGGPWIAIVALLTLFIWLFYGTTNNIIYSSRVLFAMSQDRVFFKFFGKVNKRTHTPLNAILLILVLALLLSVLYSYTSFSTLVYSVVLIQILCWMASAAGGALWPFLRANLYSASDIRRYSVAGIPLVTITGCWFLIGAAFIVYQCVSDPTIGVASNIGYVFNGGLIVMGAVTYLGFRLYNKRKEDIDVSLAYKEIPPE